MAQVFLLACTSTVSATDGQRHRLPIGEVTRSLRRVRADLVVVTDCGTGSAKKIGADARYPVVATVTIGGPAGGVPVSVLANTAVKANRLDRDTLTVTATLDGILTTVAVFLEPVANPDQTLAGLTRLRPVIVIGAVETTVAAKDLRDLLVRNLYLNPFGERSDRHTSPERGRHDPATRRRRTTPDPSIDHDAMTITVLAHGLRVHGGNTYRSPGGPVVHWARFGH